MTNSTQNIATVAQLGQEFVGLVQEREAWEAGVYAASNAKLYAILGQCLDILKKVKRFTELAKGLNGLLKMRGFKFTAGTSIEVKLLRAVFGDPTDPGKYKNRIFGYARVLSVAFDADIAGDKLGEFISSKGGIEEIRRHDPEAVKKTDREKGLRHQAEQTLKELAFTPIASGIPMTAALAPAPDQHFSVALVRKDTGGTCSIVFGSDNASLVGALLGIAGRGIDADEEEERKRRRKQEIKEAEARALAEVAAELNAVPSITPQLEQPTVAAPVAV